MASTVHNFRWTWDLRSPPPALWPLVSNTDRFNRDCGFPPVTPASVREHREGGRLTNARPLQARTLGWVAEWDELPFEWDAPHRFSVERIFRRGPVARLVTRCELVPQGSGTRLVYENIVAPAGMIGRLIVPLAFSRRVRAACERVFRRYDELAQKGLAVSRFQPRVSLAAGAENRLVEIRGTLTTERQQPEPICRRLIEFVATADDLSVARMRPYALADEWRTPRRDTLQLFLHSTRAGLLDFSWDLVCPHCRGASATGASMSSMTSRGHCPSCDVDFDVNFDQSVELTFLPNLSIRPVVRTDYCVGGPQVTPHIVAQQRVPGRSESTLPLALQPGRYRVRVPGETRQQAFRVERAAPALIRISLGGAAEPAEPSVAPDGTLALANPGAEPALAIVEHVAWSDQAATATEVTSLQIFRDLFSNEVLRPGEQISVGSMTVVFTDLKNSTLMYREIGDAPAFGRVLTHFEILKAAVAGEGGAVVKTMGDAIMAVFPRPVSALRAVVRAQHWLARPGDFPLPPGVTVPKSSLHPLALKAGINRGPCLAINQNERLDYFGSTVNIAARLCGLCSGSDIVVSEGVHEDPEVTAWIRDSAADLAPVSEQTFLRGFGDESFKVWRMRLHLGFSRPPFAQGVGN